jgi:hypothetical protein
MDLNFNMEDLKQEYKRVSVYTQTIVSYHYRPKTQKTLSYFYLFLEMPVSSHAT